MKREIAILAALLALSGATVPHARGYVLNRVISTTGGCPQLNRFRTSGTIDPRWNTSLPSNIITVASTPSQREAEVAFAIEESFRAWTSVAGSALTANLLGTLQTTTGTNACDSFDARNTICFNQTDMAFTGGVLAFTRVNVAERVGEPLQNKTAAFVGEILDADVYFRPNDANFTLATRGALTTSHFDLESVLVHELGHFFGFSHSSVWRAIMWPFVPPKGRFAGDRPTALAPDGPLADDDRTGLRVLYPDPADTTFIGSIRGRVLPANPIALATLPAPSPGRTVTGIFGAQVVAMDADTGLVVAGTLGGWSCDPMDLPTRFDGTYALERLPVGRNYILFAEPLDGPTGPGNIPNALSNLCGPGTNACTVPTVNLNFVTRVRGTP
jgi:hypothetical protein